MKEIKRKSLEIVQRPSLMDSFITAPWTSNEATFKGFYMLILYLVIIGIALEALCDLYFKGSPFDPRLLNGLISRLQDVSVLWLRLCLYSLMYFII